MNAFFLDFRQSLRGLWKAPGFMVPAALSLALGIGANTATFSALRAALTPQLAWENPQELVFVGRQDSRFPNLPPRWMSTTRPSSFGRRARRCFLPWPVSRART